MEGYQLYYKVYTPRFSKTRFKCVAKKQKKKIKNTVPPKIPPIIFENNQTEELEFYDCNECNQRTCGIELLMCDYKLDINNDMVCDRMVCFKCAGIDNNCQIPDGDWYCNKHQNS